MINYNTNSRNKRKLGILVDQSEIKYQCLYNTENWARRVWEQESTSMFLALRKCGRRISRPTLAAMGNYVLKTQPINQQTNTIIPAPSKKTVYFYNIK
jgi:hypothetical protein